MRSKPPSYLSGTDDTGLAPTATSGRETLLAAVVILFSSLSFFLTEYDRARTADQSLDQWVRAVLEGVMPAPVQYRVGLPILARFLELHLHIRANQSLPFVEFLGYALALILLYSLLRNSPQFQNGRPSHRFVLLGLFLATTQLPVLWIFPWGRPETLPSAFYLAATVVLVVRQTRMPFALVCFLAALLSFGQALVRADVSFMAGIAIVLAAALNFSFPRPRAHIAALGFLCASVAGAVQLYLQRVAYPHATYPADTPRFQLLVNLDPLYGPLHIPELLTALFPLILAVVLLRRYRLPLESSDKLVLLMSFLYLPLWLTTGLIDEVRIFVPFLFLVSPTIAKVWTAFLFNSEISPPPQPSH